jgi:DNA excision repair protein ERCC-5
MQKDMKRGDRDDDGITEDMKEDVINLLKAFGMPYIIAPAEAEAQCCKLEEVRRDEEQSRFDSRGK